jgi:hypothetical protein
VYYLNVLLLQMMQALQKCISVNAIMVSVRRP